MKYREHTTPLLSPESYIHLWRAAASKPKPRVYVARDFWKRVRDFTKSFDGKGTSGGALWLALLLAACSPKPEPRAVNLEAVNLESLVWVQPPRDDKPEAETMPIRFTF